MVDPVVVSVVDLVDVPVVVLLLLLVALAASVAVGVSALSADVFAGGVVPVIVILLNL